MMVAAVPPCIRHCLAVLELHNMAEVLQLKPALGQLPNINIYFNPGHSQDIGCAKASGAAENIPEDAKTIENRKEK